MIEVIDCEQADELLPAYMLDALDVEEAVAVATHLRACEHHRREWQLLHPVVDSLALSVPIVDQPAMAIKQQLLSQVRSIPYPLSRQRAGRRVAQVASFFIAVAIIFGLGAWGFSLRSQLTSQQAQLDRLSALQKSLQQFMLAANIGSLPVKLTSNASGSQAVAYLANNTIAMAAQGLPVLTGDSVYQCWWIDNNNEVEPGKSFKVDPSGSGVWTWEKPVDQAYHILGITLESTPGLTKPQGPLILTVQF